MPGPRHATTCTRDNARRPQVVVCFMLSALTICALLTTTSPADADGGTLVSLAEAKLLRFMRQGFERHASVMLAAIVALAVPLVALIAGIARVVARRRRLAAQHATVAFAETMAYPSAWIEMPDRNALPVAVGEITRIGDSDECELAVGGVPPGETCALIQRTPECEFFLFDVSAGATQLRVNGEASNKCRLIDGDRIEVGSTHLVFRTGLAMPASLGTREPEWA